MKNGALTVLLELSTAQTQSHTTGCIEKSASFSENFMKFFRGGASPATLASATQQAVGFFLACFWPKTIQFFFF